MKKKIECVLASLFVEYPLVNTFILGFGLGVLMVTVWSIIEGKL